MKKYLLFILHLFLGTLASMAAGVMLRSLFLTIRNRISEIPQPYTAELSSFLPAFIGLGIIAGYVCYLHVGGKSAFVIFVVPAIFLAIKILTFHAPSAMDSGIEAGWNYFFSHPQCAASQPIGLAPTAVQCMNRLLYLGALGSSIAYSVGAALASLRLPPKFDEAVKNGEGSSSVNAAEDKTIA